MESNNDIKKSLQDLKDLVMWQNQNKFQNVQDIGNTTNIDIVDVFSFEQPQKKSGRPK